MAVGVDCLCLRRTRGKAKGRSRDNGSGNPPARLGLRILAISGPSVGGSLTGVASGALAAAASASGPPRIPSWGSVARPVDRRPARLFPGDAYARRRTVPERGGVLWCILDTPECNLASPFASIFWVSIQKCLRSPFTVEAWPS